MQVRRLRYGNTEHLLQVKEGTQLFLDPWQCSAGGCCIREPITQEDDRLGFVGIGYMGRPIARRLLESGFKLTAYDRNRAKAEELIPYGGTVAHSVSELASSCTVVMSCLPSDKASLDTYGGSGGVFANAHRGLKVIDLSTVYPETSQQLSRRGLERGVDVLDVTISGSTPAADPRRPP